MLIERQAAERKNRPSCVRATVLSQHRACVVESARRDLIFHDSLAQQLRLDELANSAAW
jgi:hypothetical protein